MPISAPAFRAGCVLLTFAVTAVIVYESTQARGEPGVLELTTNEAYLGHFTIYAAMALSAMLALGRRTLFGVALVLLLVAGAGTALELYQAQVPSRSASLGDVLADVAGGLFGILVFLAITGIVLRRDESRPTKA